MPANAADPRTARFALPLLLALATHAALGDDRASANKATTKPAVTTQPARVTTASDVTPQQTFFVTDVLDGVTLRVEGESKAVILAGIVVPAGNPDAGTRAAEFLAALLVGESITIDEVPRMGRGPRRDDGAERGVVAIVRRAPGGLCANVEAVRQGFARFDDDDSLVAADEFRQAERKARQAKKGIWSDGAEATRSPPAAAPHATPAGALDRQRTPLSPEASVKDAVYVTRTGTRYHRATCASCRNGATAISLAEARSRKLTPCNTCKPGE